MDERELTEIEAMHTTGGVLSGDVGRLLAEVRRLQAENAALRARAVPEVVWPEGRVHVDVGELRLVARPDGEWWVEITTENDTEEMVSGHETSLELAQSACEAAFLRLVGAGS